MEMKTNQKMLDSILNKIVQKTFMIQSQNPRAICSFILNYDNTFPPDVYLSLKAILNPATLN